MKITLLMMHMEEWTLPVRAYADAGEAAAMEKRANEIAGTLDECKAEDAIMGLLPELEDKLEDNPLDCGFSFSTAEIDLIGGGAAASG